MLDLDRGLSAAVRHYWTVRRRQQKEQGKRSGTKDAGNRAAVTGGKHGDGFIAVLASVLRDAGLTDADIFVANRTLPGFFRPTKDWDVIAKQGDDLVAVIEIKSHVGSFGNNFNNRAEEALGSSTDFWSAYREATFKPSARPWLGYVMMLEQHADSVRPNRIRRLRHYPVRPEFQGVSYARRYEILCERLVRERLYDAACFIMSNAAEGVMGQYSEPNPELSFRNFATLLAARARAFVSLKG